jgi:hypothetical protein
MKTYIQTQDWSKKILDCPKKQTFKIVNVFFLIYWNLYPHKIRLASWKNSHMPKKHVGIFFVVTTQLQLGCH